jgi:hypothetical protein
MNCPYTAYRSLQLNEGTVRDGHRLAEVTNDPVLEGTRPDGLMRVCGNKDGRSSPLARDGPVGRVKSLLSSSHKCALRLTEGSDNVEDKSFPKPSLSFSNYKNSARLTYNRERRPDG